jgi:hypothetical protein
LRVTYIPTGDLLAYQGIHMQLSKLKALVSEAQKSEINNTTVTRQPYTPQPAVIEPAPPKAHIDLWQALELHPATMGLTVFGDFFESGFDVATLGFGVPVSLILSVFAGGVAYHWQRTKCHDPAPLAALKGCIITCLLWLPSPAFGLLSLPSGLVGMFRAKREG